MCSPTRRRWSCRNARRGVYKPLWIEYTDDAIFTLEDSAILTFLYEVVETTPLCEAVAPSLAFAAPINHLSVMAKCYDVSGKKGGWCRNGQAGWVIQDDPLGPTIAQRHSTAQAPGFGVGVCSRPLRSAMHAERRRLLVRDPSRRYRDRVSYRWLPSRCSPRPPPWIRCHDGLSSLSSGVRFVGRTTAKR